MNKMNIIMALLVLVTGTPVLAEIGDCPQVAGTYEVKLEDTWISVPARGTKLTRTQISIFRRYEYLPHLILSARDPQGKVFGSDAGDYIFDGEIHYLAWNPPHDNYFINYTAQCSRNSMTIIQEGSDNSTEIKRVSTYREIMHIEVAAWDRNLLRVTNEREVYSLAGEAIYRARTTQHLKRIK